MHDSVLSNVSRTRVDGDAVNRSRPPPYESTSSTLPTFPPTPGFSTRAYALYTAIGTSIMSQSNFNESTFSIMIKAGPSFEIPLILSIDESFEGLMNDIRLLVIQASFPNRPTGNGLKFLKVDWDSHSSRFASIGGNIQWGKQPGEMMATLRLLKQRGGIDRLIAS